MKYLKIVFEVLADSKKARALIVGLLALVVLPLLSKVGISMDEAVVNGYLDKGLLLIGAYILGQGMADVGKEKAIVLAEAEKELRATDPKPPTDEN